MEVRAETASLDAHRAELQQEADDLRVECDDLRRQVGVLQTVFEEQHGEFMTLMSRVMALRVRRGEWLDKQAVAAANNNNNNGGDTPFGGASSAIRPTGCDSVDALLRKVELALNTISTSGSTLLQQLDQAAMNAMELPTQHNAATRLHSNNAKATRTTNVIVTTTEEVRGVRAWAKQHAKECKRCAAEGIAGPPNTRATKQQQQQHTGVKAAPPLRHIAASRRKPFARASISLRSEPSFAAMDAHGTERVDLLRWKMRVEVANSATGEPVSDVAEVAKSVMALTNQWLSVLVRSVLEKLCSDAPWLREPHQNPDLHGPILFALQSAKPRTTVVGQTIACTEVADDDGGSGSTGAPSPATSSRTFLDFLISFSIPLHVPCMAPLLELLLQPAQRTYLVEHVVRPLATHISNALGFGDVVGRYTTTAATALDVIFTMANQDGMLDGTAVSRTTTRLYHVLLCLATFGSTLRVEAAAPRKEADEGLAAYCLHLARAALSTLRTPQPLILPPGPVGGRSDAVDVVVQATRLPTTFLEILNQTFSSSERLPASARSSTMDLLLSPKTKLSIGLKMYSELYINLCRPYGPATGAITEQMKNSSSGANKAPPCVPVVMRVSDDAIAENIALGAEVEELLVKLAEVEARIAATTQEQKAMLEKGQSMLVRLAEELLGAESEDAQAQSSVAAAAHSSGTRHYVSELKALNIRLSPRCGAVVGLDLILPFGLTTVDVATCTTPLIYLAVDGVFAPACGPHPNT